MLFQEKNLLFEMREYCMKDCPTLLPRIIESIDYKEFRQVRLAQFIKNLMFGIFMIG